MSAATAAEITAAYEHCRQIAKREAKNFYYAFRVLPRHKSDAMCAVYAFMRKADDLADDESFLVEARREQMAGWTKSWKTATDVPNADPVFLALKDTQRRFGVPDSLLDELVSGTTLDLYEQAGVEQMVMGGPGELRTLQVYRTFDDLYRYCYLVASVVGLVCIRIFGYTNPRAEGLAERVGVAFQLTNILRDIVEDAERGRIYLPLDDLAAAQSSPNQLLASVAAHAPQGGVATLLQHEIARAADYYGSVDELVPLLDADSRVAMQVLAQIYRELLERIAANPVAVFRERISVPTTRKLFILAGGLVRTRFSRGSL